MFNNYYGMGYNPQPQQPLVMNQLLNQNEIENLKRQGAGGIDLSVSQIDLQRHMCCHREGDHFSIIENGDGTVTCTICGERFTPLDVTSITKEQVLDTVADIKDIFNSIKMFLGNMPKEPGRNFCSAFAVLEHIGNLWDLAMAYKNKIDQSYNGLVPNRNINSFNQLSALMNPMMMGNMGGGYFQAQQPMMMQQQQPMMGMPQQQMQQPMMMPQQPMMDMQMPQQQMQQPMMMPQQPMMGGMPQQPMMQMPQMQFASNMPQQGAPIGVVETEVAAGPAPQTKAGKVPATKKAFKA